MSQLPPAHRCQKLSRLHPSDLLSLVNFTVFTVLSVVADKVIIKITRAWSIAIGAKMADKSEAYTMKGLRKRWAERSSVDDKSEASFGGGGSSGLVCSEHDVDKRQKSSAVAANVASVSNSGDKAYEIVDYESDAPGRELGPQGAGLSSSSARSAKHALDSTNLGIFKFPWEKGRLAAIFSNKPLVKDATPVLKPGGMNPVGMQLHVDHLGSVSAVPVVRESKVFHAHFMDVVRKADDVANKVDRENRRQSAIRSWWELLSHSISSSSVGRRIIVEADLDTVATVAAVNLDAVFGLKSPGTLFRRLYALQAYESWCVQNLGHHWLPVKESEVWQYVRHLQSSNAAPTRASSLLEAMRFAWFILGVDGCDEAERSLRVKGTSAQMRASKQPWRPADILTIDEVKKLHSVLDNEEAALGDRIITGHMLHLLYSRSRWSDLANVSGLYLDLEERYLEVVTRCHKGAKSSELKSKLLPIVCPSVGVLTGNWATTYLRLRTEADLILPSDDAGPMLRVPLDASARTWSERGLSSEEGSDFLRKILGVYKSSGRRISSHSLKSTSMSWTSKFGLCEQSRAVLARHVSTVSTATSVYSRDLLSPVLREFDTVLACIRRQSFEPDRTRSGLITPGATVPVLATPVPFTPVGAPFTPFDTVDRPLSSADARKEPLDKGVVKCEQGHIPAPLTSGFSKDGFNSSAAVEEFDSADHHDLFGGSQVSVEEVAGSLSDFELVQKSGPEVLVESSSTTETDSEQSTSEDSEHEIESARPLVFESNPKYFINPNSLVVHWQKDELKFKCGRKVTATYQPVQELHGMRCTRCFDV